MIKNFTAIHLVSNAGNFESFNQGLRDYERLRHEIRRKRNDFSFGLNLTVDPDIDEELLYETRELLYSLPSNLLIIYHPLALEKGGAGLSSRLALTNPAFRNSLALNVSLDQQVVPTEEAAERIIDLTSRVEREDSIYGVGSRTVPVRLSKHPENNYLRCIQENYFALAAGVRGPDENLLGVSSAFAQFGDTSTGMEVLNQAHSKYAKLLEAITKSVQTADFNGFASCYYIPIKAGAVDRITTGYACARENPFAENVNQLQESERIKAMIKYQTAQLLKTDIAETLEKTLNNLTNVARLSQFYPQEQVEFVRDLMLQRI
jgi:hypothetical protein